MGIQAPDTGRLPYNPALDGLRALAAFAVLAYHCKVPGLSGGFLGVDLFFVLSGYLITRVLMLQPSLREFFLRRAARLIPPLALMLVAYIYLYPMIYPDYPHARDAALAFFYLSDYGVAFWYLPDYLRHTWSLAVEEHFYILWPIIFMRWRPGIRALVAAYIAASMWRLCSSGDWFEWYARFDTRSSGLILGCLIARMGTLNSVPAWPGLLVLLLVCPLFKFYDPDVSSIAIPMVEMGAAIAILGRPPDWLQSPKLAYIGRLSYGIYLWHYPIARIFRDGSHPWPISLVVTALSATVLAALSYHTVEAWVRRWFMRRRESALHAEPV